MNGGEIIAKELSRLGVKFIFTLCGGHISPILSGCKKASIRVIDVRNEATAVFAADAVSKMSGVPGVAVVTAGPGVTNTITALKNAQMAQSPLILIGGATATALKGRGSLQDIDQLGLMKTVVKWSATVGVVRNLVPVLEKAFMIAKRGVPGPVFVECPIDLLYEESLVKDWYGRGANEGGGIVSRIIKVYLKRHVSNLFRNKDKYSPRLQELEPPFRRHSEGNLNLTLRKLSTAQSPVLIIGSQALLDPSRVSELVIAVNKIGIPVYLSGMARGLLGVDHKLQLKHNRKDALKDADLVILAGVPCDFRLNYGNHIKKRSFYISVNKSRKDLYKNRKPDLAVWADSASFLIALGDDLGEGELRVEPWLESRKRLDMHREVEIEKQASQQADGINPIELFKKLDTTISNNTILVADGGDFVGTAAYTLHPRAPLSWLDPGVFGTLGVGAGFALGAKLCHPESDVWIIYGDGSCGFSITEFDTFARHGIPVIALVGNDASWAQIAREQVEILKDDVATGLAYSDYHVVAQGFGGAGEKVETLEEFKEAVTAARAANKEGKPYLINAIIGKSDFRKGSISM